MLLILCSNYWTAIQIIPHIVYNEPHGHEVDLLWVAKCVLVMFVLRQYLVVVFRDKPLELWDVRTGTLLREMARNFPTVTALVNTKLFPKEQCVNQSPLLKCCSYKQQVTRRRCKMWFRTHMLMYHTCKPLNFIFYKHSHTPCCWLLYYFVLLSNCVSLFFLCATFSRN